MKPRILPMPEVYARAWWETAAPVVLAGKDVTVYDPTVKSREEFWDGNAEHGSGLVLPCSSAGWTIEVRQFPLEDERTDHDELDGDTSPGAPPRVAP